MSLCQNILEKRHLILGSFFLFFFSLQTLDAASVPHSSAKPSLDSGPSSKAAPLITSSSGAAEKGLKTEKNLTTTYRLDNGLKVLIREDHRSPVAVVMVWYDVGSADEPGGITGISHALEHMMFKGTPAFPRGVFSQIVARIGGELNAFTNTDYTAYYEKIMSSQLDTSLKLESDRMQHLLLDSEEFSKEIKVIREERRLRTEDNPQMLTYERFMAAAHLAMPYQHPVVGWMSDLLQMKIEDLRAWYQRFYAPNNATLVIVGDVKPAEVYPLVQKYFSAIPKRALALRKRQEEPPALGSKSIEVHAPAQLPLLLLGYNVPSLNSAADKKEAYGLEVLAALLSQDESGRLDQHLIRGTALASAIEAEYDLYTRYSSQFLFFGLPSEGNSIDTLKQALLKELDNLQKEPVTEKELEQVKTQLIAQKAFSKDSIFQQANEMGMLETLGLGWQKAEEYSAQIQAITPADIQALAKKYFQPKALTEARLFPS